MQQRKGKLIFTVLVSVLLVVCSFFLLYQLIRLNILPTNILFFIVSIVFLADTILILLMFFYGHHMVSKIITSFISLAVIVVSCLAGFYLMKTNSMFSNITSGSTTSKNVVSVIAKQSSDMKDLRDVANKKVGTLRLIGLAGTNACLEDINSKHISIEQVNYDSLNNLLSAFYDNEVDAVIINESSRSNILDIEEYKNFTENTRIIFQTTFETNDTNLANSVDNITEHPFNVLISGSDSRIGLSENARSDVNMLVTVNPKTATILLTSIPRDYYVTTVCDADDGCQNGALDKITHTGMHGINTTKKTIENLLGIEINYTFRVGFETTTQIVDALGGVDVTVEPGLAVSLKNVTLTEGVNHLNGEQALTYARERYSYSDGDRQRTRNQQQVLMGIINKITSPSVLSGYVELMDALGDTFETNMSANEIQALIQYQISNGPSWKIEQYMVDGSGNTLMCAELGDAAYVMVPDQRTVNLAKKKIQAVMDGKSSDDLVLEESQDDSDIEK